MIKDKEKCRMNKQIRSKVKVKGKRNRKSERTMKEKRKGI